MGVTIHQEQQSLVAYLSGEIDHHIAKSIRQEIDRACEESAARLLILDFKDVTFMDSSGIGLVMGRYQLMQTLGGEMALSNLPASIKRVMRLAGLDRLAVLDKPSHRQNQTVQNRQLKSEEDSRPEIKQDTAQFSSASCSRIETGGQKDESCQ